MFHGDRYACIRAITWASTFPQKFSPPPSPCADRAGAWTVPGPSRPRLLDPRAGPLALRPGRAPCAWPRRKPGVTRGGPLQRGPCRSSQAKIVASPKGKPASASLRDTEPRRSSALSGRRLFRALLQLHAQERARPGPHPYPPTRSSIRARPRHRPREAPQPPPSSCPPPSRSISCASTHCERSRSTPSSVRTRVTPACRSERRPWPTPCGRGT